MDFALNIISSMQLTNSKIVMDDTAMAASKMHTTAAIKMDSAQKSRKHISSTELATTINSMQPIDEEFELCGYKLYPP